MLSVSVREYSEKKFREREALYIRIRPELQEGLASCTEEESILMKLLYGTMPFSDAGEYSFDVFLNYVRHSLMLRRTVDWCRELPEDIFIRDVLYYRINSEKIEDCRPFFYDQLKDRIKGMPMERAVLEVNYWAAEHVTYKASDDRTLSPLTVYRSGTGRCGEESVFLVSALRAVGIPSRQVYVPFWAHCDDNHAWVEVYVNDEWHYLGACEPEEVLNRGWFDGAASRAMMVHARDFIDYGFSSPDEDGEREEPGDVPGRENGVYFIDRTAAYADTVLCTVSVINERNESVKGAEVRFDVLNYSQYSNIASRITGKDGTVTLRIGKGSLHISASFDWKFAETAVNTQQIKNITLQLHDEDQLTGGAAGEWTKVDFTAPEEKIISAVKPTAEQRLIQQQRAEKCRAIREAGAAEESPLYKEKEKGLDVFLGTLSDKDRKDVTEEVFRDAKLARNQGYPDNIYEACVLSPRIGKEELTPFRRIISAFFTDEQMDEFRADPDKIAKYVKNEIAYDPDLDYQTLVSTPGATLKLMFGNRASRDILMVAIARTAQVPARLDPVTGKAQFYDKAAADFKCFEMENDSKGQKAALKSGAGGHSFKYEQNWTISAFSEADGRFKTLDLTGKDGLDKAQGALRLDPGTYRIITTLREPCGNQHAGEITISLKAGETREILMQVAKLRPEDMIVHYSFDSFPVKTNDGRNTDFIDELSGVTLAVFLEPGSEPSEHVMNELMEEKTEIRDNNVRLMLLVKNKAVQTQKTLVETMEAVPKASLLIEEGFARQSEIARKLYVDPDKLPLLMLLRPDGTCIYACSGYNVGSVALALGIAKL